MDGPTDIDSHGRMDGHTDIDCHGMMDGHTDIDCHGMASLMVSAWFLVRKK